MPAACALSHRDTCIRTSTDIIVHVATWGFLPSPLPRKLVTQIAGDVVVVVVVISCVIVLA